MDGVEPADRTISVALARALSTRPPGRECRFRRAVGIASLIGGFPNPRGTVSLGKRVATPA